MGGDRSEVPAARDKEAASSFSAGDDVEVFFRMAHDKHRSFPVVNRAAAQLRPRVGWTDGWLPARVLDAWAPPKGDGVEKRVHICHTHALWSNRDGELLSQKELDATQYAASAAAQSPGPVAVRLASDAGCDGWYAPRDVRRRPRGCALAPTLSVVVVRWGGPTTGEEFNERQWGPLSASVSDRYIDSFLEHTYACLGPAYESLSIVGALSLEPSPRSTAAIHCCDHAHAHDTL